MNNGCFTLFGFVYISIETRSSIMLSCSLIALDNVSTARKLLRKAETFQSHEMPGKFRKPDVRDLRNARPVC